MKTIIVDDEESAVKVFLYEAAKIPELEIVATFQSGADALNYVENNKIDLAILDVNIDDVDGISLGSKLRKCIPDIMLIYITGFEEYAMDAIKLHAAAYLTKPYSTEELIYAVESARLLSRRKSKRIFARTFGHFDLFVDDKPIMFKSAKAKELLALLIDRQGGTVTTDQIIGTLWEDRPNDVSTQNLCSKVGKTLEKELKHYGVSEILVSSRGVRRVDTDKFDCDLYNLLEGDKKAAEQFIGEYMLEYSWAENRMALLEKYASF